MVRQASITRIGVALKTGVTTNSLKILTKMPLKRGRKANDIIQMQEGKILH